MLKKHASAKKKKKFYCIWVGGPDVAKTSIILPDSLVSQLFLKITVDSNQKRHFSDDWFCSKIRRKTSSWGRGKFWFPLTHNKAARHWQWHSSCLIWVDWTWRSETVRLCVSFFKLYYLNKISVCLVEGFNTGSSVYWRPHTFTCHGCDFEFKLNTFISIMMSSNSSLTHAIELVAKSYSRANTRHTWSQWPCLLPSTAI